MSFEGKNLYGQYIDYSEKKWPKGFICPYTWTIFYNICIYSRSQVSIYRTIGPLVPFIGQNPQRNTKGQDLGQGQKIEESGQSQKKGEGQGLIHAQELGQSTEDQGQGQSTDVQDLRRGQSTGVQDLDQGRDVEGQGHGQDLDETDHREDRQVQRDFGEANMGTLMHFNI